MFLKQLNDWLGVCRWLTQLNEFPLTVGVLRCLTWPATTLWESRCSLPTRHQKLNTACAVVGTLHLTLYAQHVRHNKAYQRALEAQRTFSRLASVSEVTQWHFVTMQAWLKSYSDCLVTQEMTSLVNNSFSVQYDPRLHVITPTQSRLDECNSGYKSDINCVNFCGEANQLMANVL